MKEFKSANFFPPLRSSHYYYYYSQKFCLQKFPSSAGAGQTPPPPNPNIPTSFPGLNQCFSAASRPGGGVNHSGAPPVVAAASNSLIAETISMSATTPSAPLLFVPSHQPHHHHHHHPTQFVPQQGKDLFYLLINFINILITSQKYVVVLMLKNNQHLKTPLNGNMFLFKCWECV